MSVKRNIAFFLCHDDENNSGNKTRYLESVIQEKKRKRIKNFNNFTVFTTPFFKSEVFCSLTTSMCTLISESVGMCKFVCTLEKIVGLE